MVRRRRTEHGLRKAVIMNFSWVLTAALPVLAALVGVLGLFVAWRTLPNKRLYFGMGRLTDLGLTEKLALTYDGLLLTNAHTLSVWLRSEGRHSIKSNDFDKGLPIILDLGPARILELLEAESSPKHYSVPDARIEGTKLEVGPGSFRPGQQANYLLIIDGSPEITCQAPLPDVRVESHEERTTTRIRSLSNKIFVEHRWVTLAIIYVLLLGGGYFGYQAWVNVTSPGGSYAYYVKSPASNEGTWMLQVPVERLPELPVGLTKGCPPALQRAVTAGGGVPVGTVTVDLHAFSYSDDELTFAAARLVMDGRSPVIKGPKVHCSIEQISTKPATDEDRLLIDLDDQVIRHVPAIDAPTQTGDYDVQLEAASQNCYCKWHVELDLQSGGKTQTFVLDDSGDVRKAPIPPANIVPFELVGPGVGGIYAFRNGHWKRD